MFEVYVRDRYNSAEQEEFLRVDKFFYREVL